MTNEFDPRITNLNKRQFDLCNEIERGLANNTGDTCIKAQSIEDQPLVDDLIAIIHDLFDMIDMLQK